MKVLIKKVGETPKEHDIDLDLKKMQEIVGGYIECFALDGRVNLWFNEEGKLIGLPANIPLNHGGVPIDYIMGDILVTAVDEEGETDGLTESEIERARNFLKNPEL